MPSALVLDSSYLQHYQAQFMWETVQYIICVCCCHVHNATDSNDGDRCSESWPYWYDGTMAGASSMPHFRINWRSTLVNSTLLASRVSYSVMHTKDHSVPGIEQQEPLRSTLVLHSPKINTCHSTLLAITVLYSIIHKKRSANVMPMGVYSIVHKKRSANVMSMGV